MLQPTLAGAGGAWNWLAGLERYMIVAHLDDGEAGLGLAAAGKLFG